MPKLSNRCPHSLQPFLVAALATTAYLAAGLPHAYADTWTWNGGGAPFGNCNWSDAANWTHTAGSSSSGTPLSSTDTIVSFAGSTGPIPNQDIANPLLLNSLNFQSGASAFQFSGNALDFATNSASVAPTIVQNSANATVIINSITLNNNTTLSGSGTGGLLFLGTITGGGSLTVTSGGNMTLLGNNNYAGGTTINGGTVVISSSNSLGTGNLTFTSGTLVSGNVTLTTNFTTNGVSAMNFQALANTTMVVNPVHALFGSMNFGSATNTGTINFEPANFTWFGGTINVNGGTLLDGADALAQTLTAYTVNIASGATFNINGFSTTINNLTGSGNLATGTDGSQTLTLTNANFSGVISGSDPLVTTANTVILTGNNTYIGGSILQGGTIGVGSNSALGTQSIAVTGSVKMYAVGAAITLPNAISLASNNLTIINNPGGVQNLTLSGNITSNGGIIMSGSGSLKLSGNNSYSGNTTLNSGELIINNNNSLGTGTLIFNGGALTASADATITNYTTASATAGVTFRADAATTLTLGGGTENLVASTLNFGSPGFTGTVVVAPSAAFATTGATLNVNAGTLRDGNGFLSSFLTSDIVTVAVGAKLDLNNHGTFISSLLGGGNITTGTDPSQQLTLITANFSGIISGSGQLLTASNSTTVILSGADTYTGGTTLAGGTIGFGNNSALSTGNISLTANTSLYAANADHTLANNISLASTTALTITNDPNGPHNLTLSGNITGAGGLIMNGTGNLTLSGNNTYAGNTTLTSGQIIIHDSHALGNGTGTLIMNGGTLTATGNATITNFTNTAATAPITLQASAGQTLTLAGALNTGTTDINFGSATNTGTINYSPGAGNFNFAAHYNINGGTLFDGDGNLGAVLLTEYVTIAPAATVDFNSNNGGIGDLLGSGTVKTGTNANETLTVTLANFSGNITGSGKLVTQSSSSITLSGASTYTGGSNFAGGTIGAGNDSAFSTGPITVTANTTLFAASANRTLPNAIVINANQTLTIQDDSPAHNLTLTSPVSGNGTFAMTGNGTLTLNASLTVNTLTIGNASTPSKVVLGAGPITSKIASLTLNSTSQLDITNDKLIIQDTSFSRPADIAQLQNEIASSSINSSIVAFINALAGRNEVAIALADDSVLQLTTFGGLPVDLNSILIAPELTGDSNFDGKVDLNDLNTVLNHLGTTTPNWTDGNFDHAPTIDLTDLNDVLNNLGTSIPNPTVVPSAPAPEPASLLTLASAAFLITRSKRHRTTRR